MVALIEMKSRFYETWLRNDSEKAAVDPEVFAAALLSGANEHVTAHSLLLLDIYPRTAPAKPVCKGPFN